jgi:tetratricopeptide (TPR) repeat protein
MRKLTLITLVLLFAACTGSKPMAKRAGKLDQAGMYAEAAEMYLGAVQRNSKNVDAKIGLKKNGQMVLDEKLSGFFKAVAMGGSRADAVNAYLEAAAYRERVQRQGVQLEIPDHYRSDFERVKGEYLMALYEEGQQLLERQDFQGAERQFATIAKLEPGYKDASSLQSVAFMEPLYRAGQADLQAGRYRKAYDEFDRILNKDANYKDAARLRQEAVTKGQYSIAVVPFTSAIGRADMASKVQAHVMTGLTQTRDPFLRIVDRENMDRILEEQRLGLSGVVDQETAVQVGNLMGAQAVLMGTVIDYREVPGQLRRSTKDGFESFRVQQLNKETGEKYYVTKYKPVRYTEHYQENKVYLSFSFRLVSLETGEVLASQVVEKEAEDHMYYAAYDGDRSQLYPANRGVVDLANKNRNELRSLLNAPRSLKSVTDLSNELLSTLSGSVGSAVQTELKNRQP